MGGSPVPPPVRDGAPHSMGPSGEPSHLFFGEHSTNHKIRWNQEGQSTFLPGHREPTRPRQSASGWPALYVASRQQARAARHGQNGRLVTGSLRC